MRDIAAPPPDRAFVFIQESFRTIDTTPYLVRLQAATAWRQ